MRQKQRFALTVWIFLPDHWHAIIYPPYPVSISSSKRSADPSCKVRGCGAVDRKAAALGKQGCATCFDHALRAVKDYWETVEYIHLNPVRRGLVKRPEQWKCSSFPEYAGVDAAEQESRCGLTIDRVRLPADEKARI